MRILRLKKTRLIKYQRLENKDKYTDKDVNRKTQNKNRIIESEQTLKVTHTKTINGYQTSR